MLESILDGLLFGAGIVVVLVPIMLVREWRDGKRLDERFQREIDETNRRAFRKWKYDDDDDGVFSCGDDLYFKRDGIIYSVDLDKKTYTPVEK